MIFDKKKKPGLALILAMHGGKKDSPEPFNEPETKTSSAASNTEPVEEAGEDRKSVV